MIINGMSIDASCEQIINLLTREVEESQGRILFSRTKSLGSNMQFSCPFHGGGMERNPSCGMRREPHYLAGKVVEAGTVHCFTCGYTAGLAEFISDIFQRKDSGRYGNQWLKRHFASSSEQYRPTVSIGTRGRKDRVTRKAITEDELEKYRWTHPYMYERKLTDDIIELFDIGYDKLHDCITMPVRDLSGQTIFFNRRSVGTKFHQYGEDDPKAEYLYGAYEVLTYKDRFEDYSKLFVTESAINCLTLWTLGIPAVALMGVGGGNQVQLLKNMPFRSIVLALDPDEAGERASHKLRKQLKDSKLVYFLDYPTEFWENKWDINDRPELLNFEHLVL